MTGGARRRRAAALVALVGLVALLAVSAGSHRGAPRPNVVIVVIDTLRADRTSLGGYGRPTTPRIDAFARDAVTFDDAWSSASWTVPAHAGLLTGAAPHRLDLFRGLDANLLDGATLAERLGAEGFDTGVFTSNPWIRPDTGLTRGFATARHLTRDDWGFPPADDVLGETLAWIRGRGATAPDRPWFALANVMDVHAPYDPPPEESRRFVAADRPAAAVTAARALLSTTGLLESSLEGRPLPPDVDAAVSDLYDGDVAWADAAVGRFLDALRSDGVLDRTLVVVTSDHGEGLGDHGWREHGLRLHRELLHVPLVVRLPGRFDGGRRVPALVRLEDVTPTVLAACGLGTDAALDGRDLAAPSPGRLAFATDRPYAGWPWLAGRDMPAEARSELEARRYSCFDGRLHVIVDSRGRVELYDVAADPRELHDLAAERPADLARLRSAVEREFGIGAPPR